MKNVIILLGMVLCLYGPMAFFAFVGYKAIHTVGNRPSDSGRAMIALATKLVITAVVLISILMVMLKVFA